MSFHAGIGVVVDVGSGLTNDFKAGDHVLLSFNFCNKCLACERGHPAYCQTFRAANGPKPTAYTAAKEDGESGPVFGHFFGQSSFARYAVVERSSLVKLPTKASPEEMALLAPLGCGLQTGAGCAINTLQVSKGSSFAVFGAGAVGLGAMMAAKTAGAHPIIAVDLVESRLELAKELGATHTLFGSREDLVEEIRKITAPTLGVEFAIDATGVIPVIENMIAALGTLGKAAAVGISRPGAKVSLEPLSLMTLGKSFTVVTEGDAVPQTVSKSLLLHVSLLSFVLRGVEADHENHAFFFLPLLVSLS